MNIAICIKHVVTSNDAAVDKVTNNLIREVAESDINPCDLNVIQFAIDLREAFGGEIHVFTMGPQVAAKSLKRAIAMGCDYGYLISDRSFAGCDTIGTALCLAEAIKKQSDFDLLLTGTESADGATGQVGPMIAEHLGIIDICGVCEVENNYNVTDNRINVLRKIEGGNVKISVKLPALFTVPYGVNEPKLPTLRSQMKANKANIELIDNSVLGIDPMLVGALGALSIVDESVVTQNTGKTASFIDDLNEATQKIKGLISEIKGI